MKERLGEIFHPGRLKQEREAMIATSQHPEAELRALTDVTEIIRAETQSSTHQATAVPVEARMLTFVDGHLIGAKAYNSFVLAGISPRWSPHASYSPDIIAGQMQLKPSQQKGLLLTYGFSPANLEELERGGDLDNTFSQFVSIEASRYVPFKDHMDPKRFSTIVKDVLSKH